VLTQFALSNVLLAFDYDGTLAPIVANRDRAPMRSRTRELLATLCSRYPCAIISGRSRADVGSYLEGVDVRFIVGNHGLEPAERMEQYELLTADIRAEVKPLLQHVPGVDIEDKRYSLAIHYRRSRQVAHAREEIIRAIDRLPLPVRSMPGKRVINILPKGAPHKGIALQELRTVAGTDTAIYLGDDTTDEDVFELDEPGRLLAIRVGRTLRTAAMYYLRAQREVDQLLSLLIRARRKDTAK